MSFFFDIALRNAARGYNVLPVTSADGKACYLKDWPNLATTNQAQIEEWAQQYPDANCAVAVSAELMVLESDDLPALEKLLGAPVPKTWTVQCRENRPHFYFYQTDKSRKMGNNDLKNVFEFKQWHRYVIAEGSVRRAEGPDKGKEYKIIDPSPIIPIPDWIVDKLPLKVRPEAPKPGEEIKKIGKGEGQHEDLSRRAGSLRNSGLDYDGMLAALLVLTERYHNPPLPLEDVEHQARSSVTLWKVPEPEPALIFSGQPTPKPEPRVLTPEDLAPKSEHPDYPDAVWQGTLFGDFADIVSRDNGIPKKFSSESLRGLTGALAGAQVTCGIAGVVMREYLAVIGLRQSGKSWSKDCAVWLYTRPSQNFAFEPMLFTGENLNYMHSGIGAQQFLPGSPNSFVDELTREDRKRKNKKGKDGKEDEPAIPIHLTNKWNPTARYITIQGEAMSLFARFGNDWNGLALAALLTDLYDGTDVEIPITKERGAPKVAIRVQYSMMLYTQPLIWRKYMSEQSMDSGLFGRFYIVGSEQKPPQATLPDYSADAELFHEHFGDVRRSLFQRLSDLVNHPIKMTVCPEARKKINDWVNSIGEQEDGIDRASRMGLHVYRAAMARAWAAIPQRTEITEEDADAAIQLGIYQVKQREFYAPVLGDDKKSKALNLVRQTIRRMGATTLRDLKRAVHAERFSEQFEWSLGWLEKRGEIAVETLGSQRGRGQKMIAWVLDRDEDPSPK